MKIQLFGLTFATILSSATSSSAQSINNIVISPIIQNQLNTAIGLNNFAQGGGQVTNLAIGQLAIVKSIAPARSSIPTSFTYPTIITNTIIAPVIQIQTNIAILSRNGIQGGTQGVTINTSQNTLVSGVKSNNNTYIYNNSYTPVYQYQVNYAAYSENIQQGGASTIFNNAFQGAIVK